MENELGWREIPILVGGFSWHRSIWCKDSRFSPGPHGRDICNSILLRDYFIVSNLSRQPLAPCTPLVALIPPFVSSMSLQVTLSTFQAEAASGELWLLWGLEGVCVVMWPWSPLLSFWTMGFAPLLIRPCLGTSPIMPVPADQPFDLFIGAPAKWDCAWAVRCQSSLFWIQWFLIRFA